MHMGSAKAVNLAMRVGLFLALHDRGGISLRKADRSTSLTIGGARAVSWFGSSATTRAGGDRRDARAARAVQGGFVTRANGQSATMIPGLRNQSSSDRLTRGSLPQAAQVDEDQIVLQEAGWLAAP
jgi:hypothetical protein